MYNCSKGFSPSQVLLASCLVQSHLSLLCTLGVTAQVWWDLPEDGHQLPSHMLPKQILVNTKECKLLGIPKSFVNTGDQQIHRLTLCLSHLLCVSRKSNKVIPRVGDT